MRVFIAIEIPESIKGYIAELQEKIDDKDNKIKPVNKNNIHLTLKFLGEVQPHKITQIKEDLKKIEVGKFSVYLDKISVFPSKSYIRVIWVGLEPEDKILELQEDIDENLKKLFKKEKNFKPHLTLARVKFIEDKKKFIDKFKKIKVENKKIGINNFKLIKSTLTKEGPIYEDLEIFG